MSALTALDPRLVRRARADQIATLFTQWGRTTSSMTLGGLILSAVMWNVAPQRELMAWLAAILVNQAWRFELVRRYRVAVPAPADREPWGRAWAAGSTIAGALWGTAGVLWFVPGDPGHQALLIVCLFGVILGGINLTAVYKPSFYGFVLPALLPLIARVAAEGDQVHAFIAAVMLVVVTFILRFGHKLNDLMTQSLAIRYENIDLIAELQAQTSAADRARTTAEAANRGKTQFLATASHDLRQPLHAMGLFAAALSARAHDVHARNLVASINASVEALERLFSALMDISKLDAGAVAPKREAFPLAPMFERLQREFGPLAAAKGLRFTVVPTRAWVDSDPVLLERILANLASNAVRYTARGGVVIGARRREGRLALEVWDSGIGIPAAERERIFEEFYQVGSPGRHSSKGMGLGLAIIRRLATLLEHPVRIDSEPGKGSRFSVEVALATPAVPATMTARPAVALRATTLSGARIAVVDDEGIVVEGMQALFAAWGAQVVGAASGEAMLVALGEAEAYPDLLIADYRLAHDELGTDVVARLRRELGLAIPALLISGDSSAATLDALRNSGVDFLLKPVLPEELKAEAQRLLASRVAAADSPERGAGQSREAFSAARG
jgi:signal transduction histidine kinase/FixJ family two-component response regulator